MDALYFLVNSERQTTENQCEDLPQVAERDGSGRDWSEIRRLLSECLDEEETPRGGTRYRVVPRSPLNSWNCTSTLSKAGREGRDPRAVPFSAR